MNRYRAGLKSGERFKVVFGGHWSQLPDWLVLSEIRQDITKPLVFASASVDVVFSEHVIEHIGFKEGVSFMRESLRILKPGGTFRVVCPVIEKILSFSPVERRDWEYLRGTECFYPVNRDFFKELQFDGFNEFNQVFLINRIFTGHGHKFIWSAALMAKVLSSIGFRSVKIHEIGRGKSQEFCIERRRRGIYLGDNPQEDRAAGYVYDAESLAVEAQK